MDFLFFKFGSIKKGQSVSLPVKRVWAYRREMLSLGYLFFVGMAFGALWLYFSDTPRFENSPEHSIAFEEDHHPVVVDRAIIGAPVVKRITESGILDEKPVAEASLSKIPDDDILGSEASAWRANAVKVAALGGAESGRSSQISIVIDDLGVVQGRTLDIIKLQAPLTLSFLPYASNLPELTGIARGRGHELMVHLPMEPKGDSDPGPHAMLTGNSRSEMVADLTYNLGRFSGYVGLNNHMGSAFTESRAGLDLVLDEVRRRGMLVLDSRTSGNSLLAEMATEKRIPNMTRDVFLDNEQDVDYILGQLGKLEEIAHRRGQAIAIGHPYPETISALKRWLPTLEKKGISIVPLSYLMQQKYQKVELSSYHADDLTPP
ncbi:divergent polysaccharide deacetylase family protein [Paremcibacter congregatus]|uniref:divergent polysaccharide deacetylase family protein n=1 Tax=Paremcibacter congregatus TaxID=2043170 RepID=UPI003A939459